MPGRSSYGLDRLQPDSILCVPYVQSCEAPASDNIPCPAKHFERPDGSHQAFTIRRITFHLCDPLCCCSKGVSSQTAHRGCAGVVGVAVEVDLHSGLSGDCLDHGDRLSLGIEHGTLFDMKFEIRHRKFAEMSFRKLGYVQPKFCDCLPERHTRCIAQLQQVRSQLTRSGQAAQKWLCEAHPLLLAESDHLNREWQVFVSGGMREFNSKDHPEWPIESACINHRIQVGADQQSRQIFGPQQSADISDCIGPKLQSGFLHPAAHQRVGLPRCGGKKQPCRLTRNIAHLRKLAAACNNSPGGLCGFTQALRLTRASI